VRLPYVNLRLIVVTLVILLSIAAVTT